MGRPRQIAQFSAPGFTRKKRRNKREWYAHEGNGLLSAEELRFILGEITRLGTDPVEMGGKLGHFIAITPDRFDPQVQNRMIPAEFNGIIGAFAYI